MNPTTTQLTIIKASLIVFAEFGKVKASIATIAKTAKVSKPLIFHHFKTKDKLFDACIKFAEYQLDLLKLSLPKHDHFMETLKTVQVAKLNLERNFPGLFKFIAKVGGDDLPSLTNPFTEKDQAKFNDKINPDQLWHLLYYLSLGYQHALKVDGNATLLIQDFQRSFALIENLVFLKEE
jgi:AcrR family transcriptional regulator